MLKHWANLRVGPLFGTIFIYVALVIWIDAMGQNSPQPDLDQLRKQIVAKERVILYELDHSSLAKELREFAKTMKQQQMTRDDSGIFIRLDDPRFPDALKLLKPNSLRVCADYVSIEFGGPFLHFGITAFREGLEGKGTKKLGPGIWFYAEDERVPTDEISEI